MIGGTLIYLLACILIAYLARGHKFGPIGWFFIAAIFSPLLAGLALFLIPDDVKA
jgi:uncharacterized membrane protein YhdT